MPGTAFGQNTSSTIPIAFICFRTHQLLSWTKTDFTRVMKVFFQVMLQFIYVPTAHCVLQISGRVLRKNFVSLKYPCEFYIKLYQNACVRK